MLPLRARVDLGAMAIKGTPHSPKLQHHRNFTIRLFCVVSRTLIGGGYYPSAEMQSAYSMAPADWANNKKSINKDRYAIQLENGK